ncbi:hypothetical protein GCM10027167_65230 [Nocardia heshunensis]
MFELLGREADGLCSELLGGGDEARFRCPAVESGQAADCPDWHLRPHCTDQDVRRCSRTETYPDRQIRR